MSYLVLARKHRPQGFDELIGQEHIADILKKSIETKRVAQAFLFCGPRGVGKTSCARILAKCLNAEGGPTAKPDQKSFIAQEIQKGTHLDVIEIDGASNRGIDEIRLLRENVKFSPSYGRYKIYIVDEVHMLTTEAFNALLKTLEEPPEHVKFIFATTEPHKVPATIISRCQRFDFKRITVKTMVEVLESVCKKEKFHVDQEALYAIAKAAQGSLRDALGTLDQISVLHEKGISAQDVYSMLGLVEMQYLLELTDAVALKDCSVALKTLQNIIDKGKDMRQLTKDVTEHFRNLMVIKVGGKSLSKLVDYPAEIKDLLLEQCQKFSLKTILTAIDAFIRVQDVARITDSQRLPLEVAIAKLTYQDEIISSKKETYEPKEILPVKRVTTEKLKSNVGQMDVSQRQGNVKTVRVVEGSQRSFADAPWPDKAKQGGQDDFSRSQINTAVELSLIDINHVRSM